ncbi:hypothetical protein ABIA38_001600 [Embleya sp. AB8]
MKRSAGPGVLGRVAHDGAGWAWAGSAGRGRGGCPRFSSLHVPSGARGFCPVLRIRAARPLRGRHCPGRPPRLGGFQGPLSGRRPRWSVAVPRLAACLGSRPLLGSETGSRRGSHCLGGCVTCGFTRRSVMRRPASAGLVPPGSKARRDKAEKAAPRGNTEHRTDTRPKETSRRSTRTPHDAPPNPIEAETPAQRPNHAMPNGQRPPSRVGEAVSVGNGHVVDGRHGCGAPSTDPGRGADVQRRDAGSRHDPAPPNRPGVDHAPDCYRPGFRYVDFSRALRSYAGRERFGKLPSVSGGCPSLGRRRRNSSARPTARLTVMSSACSQSGVRPGE